MSENSYNFYLENGFEVIGFSNNGVPNSFLNLYKGYNTFKNFIKIKAVYVGAIDNRLDFNLLKQVNDKSFIDLSIYGDGPLVNELKKSELFSVYKGVLNYSELHNTLSSKHIGLMPFNHHKNNFSRSPMKKFEYYCCGNYPIDSLMISKLVGINSFSEATQYLICNSPDVNEVSNLLKFHSWSSITNKIISLTLKFYNSSS